MGDVLCQRCNEPWEIDYLRWEGLWDHPGDDAPQHVIDQHLGLLRDDDERYHTYGEDYDRPRPSSVLLDAVVKGYGCPSCWNDPGRILDHEGEARLRALHHLVMESTYDGDPLEAF